MSAHESEDSDSSPHCSAHSLANIVKFSQVWTIKNFSSYLEAKFIVSPPFAAEGDNESRWTLWMFPNGEDNESMDYISLILCVNTRKTDGISAKFKVSILDADEEAIMTMETPQPLKFMDESANCGFKEFVERKWLLDQSHISLPDDTLTLLCEVSALQGILTFSRPNRSIQSARREPATASEQRKRVLGSHRNANDPECQSMREACQTNLGNLAAFSTQGKTAQHAGGNNSKKSLRKLARRYEKFCKAANKFLAVMEQRNMPEEALFRSMLKHMEVTLTTSIRVKTPEEEHQRDSSTRPAEAITVDVSEAFSGMKLLDTPGGSSRTPIMAFGRKSGDFRETDGAVRKTHLDPTSTADANSLGTGGLASQAGSFADLFLAMKELERDRMNLFQSEYTEPRRHMKWSSPELIHEFLSKYEAHAPGNTKSTQDNKKPGADRADDGE